MRINFRTKIHGYTFFIMLAKTQKLIGITSRIINDKLDRHYVFWDLEKCTLEQAKKTLSFVQGKYDLSDIFITSDFPKSFRAWCFSKVEFKIFLKILLDTDFLDYNFFYWTVTKGKATLRISRKQNRPEQKIIAVLKRDYSEEWENLTRKRIIESNIGSTLERVDYETGIGKQGKFIKFDFDKQIQEER